MDGDSAVGSPFRTYGNGRRACWKEEEADDERQARVGLGGAAWASLELVADSSPKHARLGGDRSSTQDSQNSDEPPHVISHTEMAEAGISRAGVDDLQYALDGVQAGGRAARSYAFGFARACRSDATKALVRTHGLLRPLLALLRTAAAAAAADAADGHEEVVFCLALAVYQLSKDNALAERLGRAAGVAALTPLLPAGLGERPGAAGSGGEEVFTPPRKRRLPAAAAAAATPPGSAGSYNGYPGADDGNVNGSGDRGRGGNGGGKRSALRGLKLRAKGPRGGKAAAEPADPFDFDSQQEARATAAATAATTTAATAADSSRDETNFYGGGGSVISRARLLLELSDVAAWGLATRQTLTASDLALAALFNAVTAAAAAAGSGGGSGSGSGGSGGGSGDIAVVLDGEGATDGEAMPIADALRRLGTLDSLAALAATAPAMLARTAVLVASGVRAAAAGTATSDSAGGLPLYQALLVLRLLELAMFRSPRNQLRAVSLSLPTPLAPALVSVVEECMRMLAAPQAAAAAASAAVSRLHNCLLAALRALVNFTHHSAAACAAVAEANGLRTLLACFLRHGGDRTDNGGSADAATPRAGLGPGGGSKLLASGALGGRAGATSPVAALASMCSPRDIGGGGGSFSADADASLFRDATPHVGRVDSSGSAIGGEGGRGAGQSASDAKAAFFFDAQVLALTAVTNCVELAASGANREALAALQICRGCPEHPVASLVRGSATSAAHVAGSGGGGGSSGGSSGAGSGGGGGSNASPGAAAAAAVHLTACPAPEYLAQYVLDRADSFQGLLSPGRGGGGGGGDRAMRRRVAYADGNGDESLGDADGEEAASPLSISVPSVEDLLTQVEADALVLSGYACLLLGCLVRGGGVAARAVLAALPRRSPSALVRVLQAFVAMQQHAGVLTREMALPVCQLIEELQPEEADDVGAAGCSGGGSSGVVVAGSGDGSSGVTVADSGAGSGSNRSSGATGNGGSSGNGVNRIESAGSGVAVESFGSQQSSEWEWTVPRSLKGPNAAAASAALPRTGSTGGGSSSSAGQRSPESRDWLHVRPAGPARPLASLMESEPESEAHSEAADEASQGSLPRSRSSSSRSPLKQRPSPQRRKYGSAAAAGTGSGAAEDSMGSESSEWEITVPRKIRATGAAAAASGALSVASSTGGGGSSSSNVGQSSAGSRDWLLARPTAATKPLASLLGSQPGSEPISEAAADPPSPPSRSRRSSSRSPAKPPRPPPPPQPQRIYGSAAALAVVGATDNGQSSQAAPAAGAGSRKGATPSPKRQRSRSRSPVRRLTQAASGLLAATGSSGSGRAAVTAASASAGPDRGGAVGSGIAVSGARRARPVGAGAGVARKAAAAAFKPVVVSPSRRVAKAARREGDTVAGEGRAAGNRKEHVLSAYDFDD